VSVPPGKEGIAQRRYTQAPVSMTTPVTEKPLRVILWSPRGGGLHYGGPGMTAYRLYRHATPNLCSVTLVHGNPSHGQYADAWTQQVYLTHVVQSVDAPWRQARFVRLGRRWIAHNARNYDVFHGLQGFDLTLQPALEAQKLGLPAVVKIAAHRSDLADKSGWRRWLGQARRRRRTIGRLSAVIAISTAIRDELLECGVPEAKIAMIPNGVDTDQFRPVADESERRRTRAELGWPDRPTILFVGSIIPRKRPHLLVEALAELRRRGVEAQVVLAGPAHEPDYTAQIRQVASDGGLEPLVLWHGFTADPAPLYRAADLFALPSANEGLPNALLEAMASGLPCLATDISGSRDLVTDGVTGRIIAPDPSPLADAIAQYLVYSRDAAAHGQAARQLAHDRYSTAAILDQHEALFRRIMHSGTV
jgi:glycosyltransferase involved in cell wall biosynthesis